VRGFVKLFVIVIIVLKPYPSTYCLMQGSCFICRNLRFEHFTSKLESQPLKRHILLHTSYIYSSLFWHCPIGFKLEFVYF